MKKGFTLVELLAVVIILTLILAIAVPTISNMIENSRQESYKIGSKMLINAVKNYRAENTNNFNVLHNQNLLGNLQYQGTGPSQYNYPGYGIYVDDNSNIAIALRYGDNCLKKGFLDSDVSITDFLATTCLIPMLTPWDGTTLTVVDPTGEGVYEINTASELAWISNQVSLGLNTFSGKTISFKSDLNLGGIFDNNGVNLGGTEWNAIGTPTYKFEGNVEGNGHSIAGVYINKPSLKYQGLFGNASGNIKNLILTDSYVIASTSAGTIGSNISGIIENISVTNSVFTATARVGSIVGQALYIKNCYANAKNITTDPTSIAGGIIGYLGANGYVNDSRFEGVINGKGYIGGLVGYAATSSTINNSSSNGTMTGTLVIGGLVGYFYAASINNSYSLSSVTGTGSSIGGIVGFANASATTVPSIKNSYATGTIKGLDNVGGLVGMLVGTVDNSYATGSIYATAGHVGGLVGMIGCTDCNHSTSYAKNSYATGNVNGVSEIGGLVGQNGASSENARTKYTTIINCYSTGNVTGTGGTIGGLVGTDVMNISSSFATGNVSGTSGGRVIGNKENTDSTITNSYYKENQTFVGISNNSIGTSASLNDLTTNDWYSNTLGFGSAYKYNGNYYPTLYEMNTLNLLNGQTFIGVK